MKYKLMDVSFHNAIITCTLQMPATTLTSSRALSSAATPLKTCDTYVQSKSRVGGGQEKFSTTLVPLTDKEIEVLALATMRRFL